MLPGALDLQVDGVGVIGKQQTSNQTKYPACNTSAVPGPSNHVDQRDDEVKDCANTGAEKVAPDPVDHEELLVHLHHEDAEEDHREDHFADGQGGVASSVGRAIADDDDETDEYFCCEDEPLRGLHVTCQLLQAVGTGAGRGCVSHSITTNVNLFHACNRRVKSLVGSNRRKQFERRRKTN